MVIAVSLLRPNVHWLAYRLMMNVMPILQYC